jgi:hypothetical protein
MYVNRTRKEVNVFVDRSMLVIVTNPTPAGRERASGPDPGRRND